MEEVQEQEEKKRIHNSVVIKTISEDRVAIMESKAVDEDEFHGLYEDGAVLEPLYNPEQLTRLSENSDILQQCIDAYKTNIVGFGVDFDYDIDVDKQNESIQSALDKEWTKYENFFKFCNFDESYTEIMKKVVDDRERIGWGTLEVIEDAVGRPAGLEHIPAHKVRLCKRERKAISVKTMVPNDNGELIEITIMKKFRKFVQIVDSRKVFFKEFGDPRTLNCKTGLYDEAAPDEDKATSIIFFNIYCPYTPYGLPRYIGQLLNVQGNRKAEELNYTYFMDGRHMPMAIIVENGKLTDDSIQNISNSKGDKASVYTPANNSEGPVEPPEPFEPSLEELKAAKRREISATCEQLIYAGVDVTLADKSVGHFSLSEHDQINLFGKQIQVTAGMEKIEYHADGQPCRYYSKEDMQTIITAAMWHVSYHTTYCNALNIWIAGIEHAEDLETVSYGVEVPEAYQSDVLKAYLIQKVTMTEGETDETAS